MDQAIYQSAAKATNHQALVFTHSFSVFSFLFSHILSLFLFFRGYASPILPIVLLGIVIAGWYLPGFLVRRHIDVRWVLSLAVLNLIIVVPELALRVSGFSYQSGIQYGNLRPAFFSLFVPDKDLYWKLPPSASGVNSLGFWGEEIETPKPHGVFRILFFGDSCTEQDFARYTQQCIRSKYLWDMTRYECIPVAVSGYSSYQGRVMAQKYGAMLEPDAVVVYFGWNDHWLAYRATDAEFKSGRVGYLLQLLRHHCRLVQLGARLLGPRTRAESNEILDAVRVPPDRYRENLVKIKQIFDAGGIPVVFITAPTSHYRLGVPDYLVDCKYVPDKKFAADVHRRYNRIVREVAGHTGAYLLDLEAEIDAIEDIDKVFQKDGIHFSPEGLKNIGKRICDFMDKNILARYQDRLSTR
ncbi:MAG: hypothetical protein JSV44_06755 [Candidatus Zixiibacteriota bacterium]|nr:MAG: hypothetical protein JSV44_06755 [candidate division Zixibacteria bacterium]